MLNVAVPLKGLLGTNAVRSFSDEELNVLINVDNRATGIALSASRRRG
jgi:hypothetical protein